MDPAVRRSNARRRRVPHRHEARYAGARHGPVPRLKSSLYKPLGLLFLLLGSAGLVLPVLPTTPFILLAAWCFARSSEAWHQRLLASELFGPIIDNWERNRCIALRTKVVAIGMMLLAGGASIAFAMEDYRLRLVTAALMLTGGITVLRLKTCPECREDDPA